jgi:dipeptidyl aminopeptidase/acylaminoacyl peptidase
MALCAAVAAHAQEAPARRIDALTALNRYDPRLRFRTISTARFDIYFHQDEEALAHRLAGFVEEVASQVDRRLGAPRGRIRVILVDQSDQSNGWATVFPYNLIELAAVSPATQSTIGNTADWLRLVFSHEYTHIVHLEQSRGWIGGLGRVFGRLPVLYPNAFLPEWQIEGIATYEESVVTGRGRVPSGDFRMILNGAAAAGRFASIDRAGGGVVGWPSGNAPYLYGAYFHEYLASRYGPESLARLAGETAGALPFFGSRAFRTVFGRSLGAIWRDFEADTIRRSESVTPPTRAVRRTAHGFIVSAPAFGAGGRLFYSVVNPHGFPAILELRADGSEPRQVATRYLGERLAAAGGTLVFNQLEIVHDGGLQSDLYAVSMDGGETRRLTREARAADADVSPDGRTIVCTVQASGRRLLATLPIPARGQTGVPAPLVSEASTEFSTPRWSPDGRAIAAERRRLDGPSEIVIIDAATRDVRILVSSDRARNAGPMWLPDGSAILFSSDREAGPFQIYAADIATGAVRRLLGTGASAQFPALSPDGRQLMFVGYTADGYDLYSMPFDAPEWSSVQAGPPARRSDSAAAAGDPGPVPHRTGPADARYSPWSTLVPRYWAPVIDTREDDILLGASTSGFDALGRHAYFATGAWALSRNRPDWQAAYTYSRWWPTLFAAASDTVGGWRAGDVRSRELTAGALLPVRRVRWSGTAFAGLHASRDVFDCPLCEAPIGGTVSRSELQAGWMFSSAKAFGYSISPEEGAVVAVTSEVTRRSFGADGNAGAATGDVRGYFRLFPRHGVIAARAAGAASWGDRRLRRVFNAAGSGSQAAGFDFESGAIALLRGFDPSDLFGYHAVVANVDYRFPLAWPERGHGTLPVMLRNIHGAVFADVGNAWDAAFRRADLRRSFGAEISADTVLGYSFPLTLTAGAAWRSDPSGRRPGWAAFARAGRAF